MSFSVIELTTGSVFLVPSIHSPTKSPVGKVGRYSSDSAWLAGMEKASSCNRRRSPTKHHLRVARRAYVRAYMGEVLHLITTYLLLVVHVYTRHTRLGREDFDLYVGGDA
jgi:hypothetical protein